MYYRPECAELSVDDILMAVSSIFNINPENIIDRLYGNTVDARKAAIMALRRFKYHLKTIGRLMKRHYSTIIYLDCAGHDLLFSDKQFKAKYDLVIQELEALRPHASHAA